MGSRVVVERMMNRRARREGAEEKDNKANDHAQNRAGRSLSQLVLPVHEDFLSQCRTSGKPFPRVRRCGGPDRDYVLAASDGLQAPSFPKDSRHG